MIVGNRHAVCSLGMAGYATTNGGTGEYTSWAVFRGSCANINLISDETYGNEQAAQ